MSCEQCEHDLEVANGILAEYKERTHWLNEEALKLRYEIQILRQRIKELEA